MRRGLRQVHDHRVVLQHIQIARKVAVGQACDGLGRVRRGHAQQVNHLVDVRVGGLVDLKQGLQVARVPGQLAQHLRPCRRIGRAQALQQGLKVLAIQLVVWQVHVAQQVELFQRVAAGVEALAQVVQRANHALRIACFGLCRSLRGQQFVQLRPVGQHRVAKHVELAPGGRGCGVKAVEFHGLPLCAQCAASAAWHRVAPGQSAAWRGAARVDRRWARQPSTAMTSAAPTA